MRRIVIFRSKRLTGLLLAMSTLFAGPAFADPAHVLLRLPAGARTPEGLASTLSAWRQSGQVSDVLWLESDQEKDSGFADFIALEFPSEGSYDAWTREGQPKLPTALEIKRVDVLTHGEKTPRDSNNSVFKVNLYEPAVPAAKTREFAHGYIKPLMDGQIAGKLLMRYTMYLERGEGGKNWLLMEYRDPVAFEKSEAFKGVLRPRLLAENATYAAFDKVKEGLRKTGPETMAEYKELPPPQLPGLPSYKPEFKVVGGFRIVGSELKNAVNQLAEGFAQFHPEAKVSTSHIPSSEGGIAGLYMGVSDVAPMGDDAKITDMMPFYNTFGYMPTEISVATGGYEKRGSLFAWAIAVNKDNPINEISIDQLDRVFGSERSGGWELYNGDYKFTSKFARDRSTNIRNWGQLGVRGALAKKEIETFGYAAPGFAIAIQRHLLHWSYKMNPNFKEYVEAKQTVPDTLGAAVASTVGLEELSKNPNGMGIVALMHAKNYPNVKILNVIPRSGGAAVPLTPDTVANRTYPLIRDAYFYVNRAPGQKLDPKVREFMRFVLSREGQEIIARVGYYYPLTAEYLAEQLKKLD
ncbi:ABC-type phosphate transport system substrate-binding protein [Novosphingobium kunmingense]|uniref:ABC-type phosphate transport system substrate-binding protein n=1 Tax=Novosphingobium kunmingense TaxID=1211806 RepID=A0A2N0HJ98_9SPHN|nr:substrate-binding domain-containing protein [Novosphingobium kunmingense]PKB19026.1 ABC-type phosphate transport system substrate-binding protein [Novosphingobium kunmingense]